MTSRHTFSSQLFCGVLALLSGTTLEASGNEDVPSRWQVIAGGGIEFAPEFPGSDSNEMRPIPAFNIRFGDRWFLNGDGFGAYVLRNERWSLSTSIALDMTRRDESDAAHLRGTGDVDRTALAMVKGAYRLGIVTIALGIGNDIADEGHGTVADLSLQLDRQMTQQLSLSTGVAARWIDDEYAETFFGVSAQQSLASGLMRYNAASGIGDARAFVNLLYRINERWMVSTGAALGQLQSDAADSPIVEDDTYYSLDTALMYRF